jgi:hypothetical protein
MLRNFERWLFRQAANLFGAKLTRQESHERKDEGTGRPSALDFTSVQAGDKLLAEAIRQFDNVEKRRMRVEEKAKVVLTLVAFIFSFTTVVTALWGAHWLLLLPVVPALGVAWLFFEIFSTGMAGSPNLNQDLVKASGPEFERLLADQYVRAATFSDLRTDYVVSVLIAARRMALTALLLLVIVVAVRAALGVSEAQTASDCVKALRNNQKLQDMLRGPQGVQGPVGPSGPTGPMGPVGPSKESLDATKHKGPRVHSSTKRKDG